MQEHEREFLTQGTRLGTWWVPEEADLDDEGNLHSLPERREAGLFTTAADGEWSLLLATDLDLEEGTIRDPMPREFLRRELMWGKTQGSTLSLFDATFTDGITDSLTYAHNVWRGPWYVDSPSDWFIGSDRVEHIYIEIAAAVPWSDMPPGKGRKHNLHMQWDHEEGVFKRPEPAVHDATVNGTPIQLMTATDGDHSESRFKFELTSHFRVTDEIAISQVLEKWIEPLHDLIGIFWLKNPGIVSVSVQRPSDMELSSIAYSGRFAPVEANSVLDSRYRFAPFTTIGGLAGCGYSFEDLITGYWDCRMQGYGRAIQRLNESQDSHLDHSLDARMLSAVKSLEAHEKARTGHTGTANVAKAADYLVGATGSIGEEVRDIWVTRGPQPFKNSIAQIRSEYLTHEQSGTRLKTRSDSELTDQYWHHVALQWLLRRRLLATIGIQDSVADHLVADSLAYKEEIKVMRDHYADS